MITKEEILMGREKEYPLGDYLESNLDILWKRLCLFRESYNLPMVVTSGYRPGVYNEKAGGAVNSKHKILMACDFKDEKGELDMFCITNKNLLKKIGLYVEDPKYTKGWCHLQASAPPSGAIFFVPYNGSPKKEAYDKLFENIRY